jgi:hypothetical protein
MKTSAETTSMRPSWGTRDSDVALTLERVAWLMDRAIRIPGTRISLGLDALLGLFPLGGDVVTGLVQAGLVLVALKHYRVPGTIAARMVGNVALDVLLGSIPILGDLFDVGFKANTKNVRLLEEYRERSREPLGPIGSANRSMTPSGSFGKSWRFLAPAAVFLLAILGLVVVGFITVVRWLLQH